jgi:hypothetical protein
MRQQIHDHIKAERWPEAFTCLSPMEQRIMVSIANSLRARMNSGGKIAIACLADRQTISVMVRSLNIAGLLDISKDSAGNNLYAITHAGMFTYCKSVDKFAVWDGAIDEIANQFYDLAAQRYEALEHGGFIRGNGHHAAQKVAQYVKEDLIDRWINKK